MAELTAVSNISHEISHSIYIYVYICVYIYTYREREISHWQLHNFIWNTMADVCKLSMYIYIYIYIYIFPSISILSPCDSPFPSPGLTDETRREGGEGHHQQQQRHGPVTGQTKGVGHRQDACETAAKWWEKWPKWWSSCWFSWLSKC